MSDEVAKFQDGAAYERAMAPWSRLAGDEFLDWLAPSEGLSWIDVGCGNGVFTELIVQKCAPGVVEGIDPSEGQIAYARDRQAAKLAKFQQGDAMALPYPDDSFDVATMALVIFFVPEPAKGISEMVRVVRPDGTITAYAWDIVRNGFPFGAVWDEMDALGITPNLPPNPDAARMECMRELWSQAGLENIETREIVVQRTFDDFESFWANCTSGNIGAQVAEMSASLVNDLKKRVQARLPNDAAGRITFSARANATKGRLPN